MASGSRRLRAILSAMPLAAALLLGGMVVNERHARDEAEDLLARYGAFLELHLWNYDAAAAANLLRVIAQSGVFVALRIEHADGRPFAHADDVSDASAAGILSRRIPLLLELTHDGQVIGRLSAEWNNQEGRLYVGLLAALGLIGTVVTLGLRLALQRRELRERIRGEAALRQAREEAEHANLLKTQFLANMSHEIRTPLNVILGSLDMIERDLPPSEVRDRHWRSVRDAGARLMDTIQKIIDISRVQVREFPFRAEPLPLVTIVRETLDTLAVLADRKGLALELEVTGPSDDVYVLFDAYALRQTLLNLIDNAIKYTDEGRISVAVAIVDEMAEIRITDTGIGIGEAFLGRAFEPFAQEDFGPGRGYEGTGLGLALAHDFVEAGSGAIWIESRRPGGTVVTVRLPLAPAERTAAAPESLGRNRQDRPPFPSAAAASQGLLIVVEDDPATQLFMRAALTDRWRVETAASAAELDALLARERVDLILMDVGLRGSENGISITRRLRNDERFRAIPITALTGYAFETDRQEALAAGCDAFLTKPCPLAVLRNTIDGLLQAGRSPG